MKRLSVLLVLGVIVSGVSANSASAVPQFLKQFEGKYAEGNETYTALVKKTKCNVCHMGKKKKDRNAYGMELSKLLTKKDKKDNEKIQKALDTVSGLKPAGSEESYGDRIKAGKLPAGE